MNESIPSHRAFDAMYPFLFRTVPLSCFNLLRLFLFVVFLCPGFVRFAWYYFVASDRISVRYGDESVRQRIDVYRSCNTEGNRRERIPSRGRVDSEEECRSNAPVIIFCTGGAWMIGYKMWGALLARALTAAGVSKSGYRRTINPSNLFRTRGISLTELVRSYLILKIVVVIPDLRNYPLVYIPRMVDDVESAVQWTKDNIAQYGGDPSNIVVVGQSAGGHVACMALFRKIRKKVAQEKRIKSIEKPTGPNSYRERTTNINSNGEWMASDLKGFAAISSPLNLGPVLTASFRRLGFDDALVDRMFGFEKDNYDPYLALQELQSSELKRRFLEELPPIRIYQGTDDKTVPQECSESFHREILNIASKEKSVSFVSYEGWSHTDPILEGPMDGDHRLHKDLFDNVKEWTTSPGLIWPNDTRINERLCPHFLVEISRYVNPF